MITDILRSVRASPELYPPAPGSAGNSVMFPGCGNGLDGGVRKRAPCGRLFETKMSRYARLAPADKSRHQRPNQRRYKMRRRRWREQSRPAISSTLPCAEWASGFQIRGPDGPFQDGYSSASRCSGLIELTRIPLPTHSMARLLEMNHAGFGAVANAPVPGRG